MLLPCALLYTLLFRRNLALLVCMLRLLLSGLSLGVLLPILVLPRLLFSALWLLLFSVCLLLALGLPLLLVMVLLVLVLSVLGFPLSPGWLLLLFAVALSFCLSMLLFGLGLLLFVLLLMVLLFAVASLLCVGRSSDSEKQRKNGCAGDSNCFHRCYLNLSLVKYDFSISRWHRCTHWLGDGLPGHEMFNSPVLLPTRRIKGMQTAGRQGPEARVLHLPTWIREMEWKIPKTLQSHRTTAITTTPFNIDLMDPCMGTKRFTSHSSIPTTTRTSRS
jgi:hypothetical protein